MKNPEVCQGEKIVRNGWQLAGISINKVCFDFNRFSNSTIMKTGVCPPLFFPALLLFSA